MICLLASRRTARLGIAGLIVSILGFAAALIVTIDQADLHFRRAEIAQDQFAALMRAVSPRWSIAMPRS
jgi:hypothetical protein